MSVEQDDIVRYVAAVGAALGDLPDDVREELLEDLPAHLAEVAAEVAAEGGGATLADRLGTPAAYAAELRASLGHTGGPSGLGGRAARWTTRWRGRLNGLDRRVGTVLGYERAGEFLRALRPAWWVLRGWLLAIFIAQLPGVVRFGLVPRVSGNLVVGILLLAACVVASIWVGRNGRPRQLPLRLALLAASLGLAGFGVVYYGVADQELDGRNYDTVADYYNPYEQVRDVWVVGPDGQLIPDARLVDQNGDPVLLGYCAQMLPKLGTRQALAWSPDKGLQVLNDETMPYSGEPVDFTDLAWQVSYPACGNTAKPPVNWMPGQPQPLPWADPTASPQPSAPAPTASPSAALPASPSAGPTPRPSASR
ncbi:hypothetical protein Cs7R123_33340 [Catellatospora sp. TT07R-123]|uniref:hypothetical protein n=1 Tax=Catellatospora sp. TT07R-123 TaxID=2733863 RepID=UPI001B29FD3F|nr:hypothetical protein [Catellatospora sp. TT07R-123]GHJ45992.1 hypothetical protein Cs7R123_33340 [Catellatospora sp. TT07R-123]